MKIKSTRGLANSQCSRMDNNKINKIYKPDYYWGLIWNNWTFMEKKRLTYNTGSGLYSANYWRAKFALFTDQCISRVGSLEILIKQLAFQNWLHFLNILLPFRKMPIPAILFHTIANFIFQWSKKVVRGGATKGPLDSWCLHPSTQLPGAWV